MKLRVVVFWGVMTAACAHASLDRSKTVGPHQEGVNVSDVPVRGAAAEVNWVPARCSPHECSLTTQGELIAVDEKFVYVSLDRNQWKDSLKKISREEIETVSVEVRPSAASEMGAWTALGCASTLSHGFYLVFTGPLWLVAGISATADESAKSHAQATAPRDLDQLYQFARFPQGLPTNKPPPAPRPPVRAEPVAVSRGADAGRTAIEADAGLGGRSYPAPPTR